MDEDNKNPESSNSNSKYQYDYGVVSETELTTAQLLLEAFRIDAPPEAGGLGRPYYFWKLVDLFWGPKSKTAKKFFKHPWAERMVELMCQHRYLGVHGAGSTGKTETSAIWALINWMSDPINTLVLVTSTSLKDSRKRIWGSIIEYFQAIDGFESYGQLVDSIGMIRSITDDGTISSDKSGIALIPGEKKKEKEAIGKIIGMKNANVIMVADELPELSEALISAAQSNLCLNPRFQMIGLGNFNSIYDPLGVFVTPKNGWGSITVEDAEWETKEGYCIRFDGMKSPNVLAGKDIYPRIYNAKNLAEHQKRYGVNSALFWRMCRSFPCPEGAVNSIYSDADFIKGEVNETTQWMTQPVTICAADPAFTNDGDDFSVAFGKFGTAATGIPTLLITEVVAIKDDVELSKQGEARDLQTGKKLAEMARERGVRIGHLGVDCSGPGGLAFGSILSMFWGSNYLPIKFGEQASDLQISDNDTRRGSEAFMDLASEMWFLGRDFVRAGQIKGMPPDVAKLLKARYYKSVKSGDYMKVKIEPKKDMKKRIGESPDAADAVVMLIFLCRFLFGFSPGTINSRGALLSRKPRDQEWMARVKAAHSIYENAFTN